MPLSREREGFRSENFKSTFAIFFSIHLKVNDVLFDRRMIKSQKTTGAMTAVLMAEVLSSSPLFVKSQEPLWRRVDNDVNHGVLRPRQLEMFRHTQEKIINTQLRFMILNFLFVCQIISAYLKLNNLRLVIVCCYNNAHCDVIWYAIMFKNSQNIGERHFFS